MSFMKAAQHADEAAKNARFLATFDSEDYRNRVLAETLEALALAVAELARSEHRAQP